MKRYNIFNQVHKGLRDVNGSRELNPDLQNFEQWLKENAKKILLE